MRSSRSDAALPPELAEAFDRARDRLGPFAGRIYYFAEIGSTNDVAASLAPEPESFGTVVIASFDLRAVTLVYDYPASQAALARVKPTTPPVAARFEAFCGGVELANGFRELNDAAEQRRRFLSDTATRRAAGRHAPPLDEDLLRALPSLPDCAGVALGFDRLVALATGQNELKAVLGFAHGKD